MNGVSKFHYCFAKLDVLEPKSLTAVQSRALARSARTPVRTRGPGAHIVCVRASFLVFPQSVIFPGEYIAPPPPNFLRNVPNCLRQSRTNCQLTTGHNLADATRFADDAFLLVWDAGDVCAAHAWLAASGDHALDPCLAATLRK